MTPEQRASLSALLPTQDKEIVKRYLEQLNEELLVHLLIEVNGEYAAEYLEILAIALQDWAELVEARR